MSASTDPSVHHVLAGVTPLTHEILRGAVPDPDERRVVHVGG